MRTKDRIHLVELHVLIGGLLPLHTHGVGLAAWETMDHNFSAKNEYITKIDLESTILLNKNKVNALVRSHSWAPFMYSNSPLESKEPWIIPAVNILPAMNMTMWAALGALYRLMRDIFMTFVLKLFDAKQTCCVGNCCSPPAPLFYYNWHVIIYNRLI